MACGTTSNSWVIPAAVDPCFQELGTVVGVDLPVPTPVVDPGLPAMWTVLVLILIIGIFEAWALKTHHNTISHWMQRLARGHSWVKWLGALGLGILGWHLFWGFP